MIITTTPTVEGATITAYHGIVFGEVITGVNILKDIGASVRDIFGGRSKGYEQDLIQARQQALEEMVSRARDLGCNAVVGVKLDYEMLGASSSMMMVIASGTGVTLN